MTGDEFRRARESLGLGRKEAAELLGLSGYNAIANIELGVRNPSKLAAMVLKALIALSDKKAKELIELLRRQRT
jgi:transcriptional regulator with XRE-family HTH domain